MGKATLCRHLRKAANGMASEPYGTTNENIDVKQVKSGKMVLNDRGVFVEEIVPKVVFNTELVPACARKLYKVLKKEAV